MYFLKTRGTNKIPDYIQIRDDNFALIAHFKTNHHDRSIEKLGLKAFKDRITELIETIPYGKLIKIKE